MDRNLLTIKYSKGGGIYCSYLCVIVDKHTWNKIYTHYQYWYPLHDRGIEMDWGGITNKYSYFSWDNINISPKIVYEKGSWFNCCAISYQ